MASIDTVAAAYADCRSAPQHSTPTALCLHCSTGSSRQWTSLAAALDDTHQVVAPDLLGYGENLPWSDGRQLTLDEEVSRLLPFLEHADAPVDVVGHSFGGAVAVKLALTHPQWVRSLCVYEPVLLGLLRQDERGAAALSEILETSALFRGCLDRGADADAAALFIDFWSGPGTWRQMPEGRRDSVRTRIGKVRADFEALLSDDMTLSALAELDIPVLCLSGKRSPAATRRVTELLDATLPNVRSRCFDNAGHMGPITEPHEVNASIAAFFNFLSRHGGRSDRGTPSMVLTARAA
jgi:pimeloyl-ACP methyl ester carboxylesterase